jgi:heme oxygenase
MGKTNLQDVSVLTPLSRLMRESSQQQHQEAESSPFVAALMRGELSLGDYTTYLVQLAWLYDALERQAANGVARATSEPLWDSRLNRLDAITADLAELGIGDWRETTAPSSSMATYIAHLDSLSGRADVRLVAHHYTRYLGDLSGGQAIAALVARHYGATPAQLSFYRFGDIDDIVRYKEAYRGHLDGLDLTPEESATLITEVQLAFTMNQRVFDELSVVPTPAG